MRGAADLCGVRPPPPLTLTLTPTLTLTLTLTRRDAQGVVSCLGSAQGGAPASSNHYAVAEHQGLVYLWRGDPATVHPPRHLTLTPQPKPKP